MSAAIITDIDNTWLQIDGDYNETFIETLKREIPRNSRYWNSNKKAWLVNKKFKFVIMRILEENYDYVDIQISDEIRIKKLEEELCTLHIKLAKFSDYEHNFLGLLPTAENIVVKAAYKALTLANHPDKGGSEEYMKQLNTLYNTLRIKRNLK